ncbi:DMT family transporter [Spirosoma endophyticum]|uniref:EamA-like transporter family protein n=1 Tax=Spirosoma endophyticum TaxID=662367 RepID=A0A1I2H0G7_9BACT|nr:DMT family transporter [Spirosoma endophyticum]SFF23555.1 EamA-like transporter family protein [Spirosoma endophyticum]
MSLYVLSLVLTAAVLHASWNLLSKKTQGKTPYIWLMYIASNAVYLPLLLFQMNQGVAINSPPLLWFSLSSAILHLGYYIVLQKGYRRADLSVVYPLARGSGPLFSSIVAIVFLHEPLRITATLGLFLIIAGVLLITGLSFKKEDNQKLLPGITYGVLTGLFIALYTLNDTIAVKTYSLSPLPLTLGTNLFGAVLLFPFIVSKQDELKREIKLHKWLILAIAILSPAAYILVLEALKYAPLTVVAPARETSILVGVFMGSRVFDEEDGRRRLMASGLILGGIIALSLS